MSIKILSSTDYSEACMGKGCDWDMYFNKRVTVKLSGEIDGGGLQSDTRQLGVILNYDVPAPVESRCEFGCTLLDARTGDIMLTKSTRKTWRLCAIDVKENRDT